jgi:5,10-methenyltetrahydrofolate synthetase
MKQFDVSGIVIRGIDLGARFGVATANIDTDFSKIAIEEGVYFVEVQVEPAPAFCPAIMHYGLRKTFGGDKSIEIHLLDFTGDLYEKTLNVLVKKHHRPIKKFPNADVLFTQIETDIVLAKKYFLRVFCQKKWSEITEDQKVIWAQKTCQKLSEFSRFISAKNILVFVPMADEIPFVEDLMRLFPVKKFFFPRVDIATKNMQFFASNWADLLPGQCTLKPIASSEIFSRQTSESTLVLVPALAVSAVGTRLGRGGGFYDRFLAECQTNPNISTLSVQPEFAVFGDIPVEAHDQGLDAVLVA